MVYNGIVVNFITKNFAAAASDPQVAISIDTVQAYKIPYDSKGDMYLGATSKGAPTGMAYEVMAFQK